MGRPRKIQTPGVTAPAEQQPAEPVEMVGFGLKEEAEQLQQEVASHSAKKQAEQDPSRPKRWVLQADGWHHE